MMPLTLITRCATTPIPSPLNPKRVNSPLNSKPSLVPFQTWGAARDTRSDLASVTPLAGAKEPYFGLYWPDNRQSPMLRRRINFSVTPIAGRGPTSLCNSMTHKRDSPPRHHGDENDALSKIFKTGRRSMARPWGPLCRRMRRARQDIGFR